ncbi:MAG: hypothetical protein Q9162_005975 [Coniocarpon cinnabarinum]
MESLVQIPLICLNTFHERADDDIVINTVVGNAHIRGLSAPLADVLGSRWVYLKFFELGGTATSCDIYVFDEHGKHLSAIILDVGFTRCHIKSLLEPREIALASTSLQVTSRQKDSPEATTLKEEAAAKVQDPELCLHNHAPVQSDDLPDVSKALFDVLARMADVDTDRLHGGTVFADLGIDSLMGMDVTDEISKIFAVEIDNSDLVAAENLGALCQWIADKAPGFLYDPRASLGSGAPTCGLQQSQLDMFAKS